MKVSLLLLLLGSAAALPLLFTQAQQSRGQTVRIRVETGQELDLYDESHALVIGVSDYNNGWRKLPGVKRDVAEVADVLARQGFKVTRLLDPTVEDFERALRNFISLAGLRERNRLVVYFAGHGHTERLSDERDLGYIVMRNAPKPDVDPAQFSQAAISMDQVNAWAQRIKSKHALFVFDSCFSGSLFRSETDKRRPARIESKSAGPVRQFITSGNAGQEVPDDSLFRRYFVRAFDGEGDLDGDGYLTGEELGIFLSGRVASDTGDTQTPRYGKIRDARLNLGDVVFVLPKKAAPTPAPTPAPAFDPAAVELALWQSAQRNDEISDYEEYLRQYPQGRFAVSARNRIARLRAPVAANNNPPPVRPAPSVRMSVAGVPLTALAPFTTVTVDAQGQIASRREQQECWGYVEDLGNGVRLEMVELAAGEFMIGSPTNEAERSADEGPQQRVRVSGFLLGRYEVTQGQWKAVMGGLPPNMSDLSNDFKGDNLPVVMVSWEEAQEFIKRLNAKLRLPAGTYRLPSEAEWEYAARAGTTTPFAFGATITPQIVNYDGNYPYGGVAKGVYRQKLVAVGSLGVANAWGLFDLHGNVWEWCEDDWHDNYSGIPTNGRAWVSAPRGSARVARGGGWIHNAVDCRSAIRLNDAPGERYGHLGLRLART